MKVSGFIRDVRSVVLDRLVDYNAEGILGNVYVQVEHNEPDGIQANLHAWPVWKDRLPGKVYAWLWGEGLGGGSAEYDTGEPDADRIARYGTTLDPDGWLLNDEAPTKWEDRTEVYEACGGKPIIVSPAGWPQISPYDHRHMSQYGAKVEYQAGGPDGSNTFTASLLAREMSEVSKVILWEPGAPSSWWYRVFFDNLLGRGGTIVRRWAWVRAVSFANGVVTLAEGSNRWGVSARDADGYGFTLNDRIVFNKRNSRNVGRIWGVVKPKDIRVSLSVERPILPESLGALASSVRIPDRRRGIALYTLDNTSDAQFRAVAATP